MSETTSTTPGPEAQDGPNKMRVALDILCQGYVQSYIDFFYLVHKDQSSSTDSSNAETEVDHGPSSEEILFLKDTLTSTEKARRCADTPVLYENYQCLAKHFQSKGDPKTSIYFYEKCLEIARLTKDVASELQANHCLGLAHQSLKQFKEAIEFHERQFFMSKDQGLEARRSAGRELLKVYAKRALALEEESPPKLDEAISFHNKCLSTAKLIFDREAQDTTSYSLARAYVMKGESRKAIEVLEPYIESCKIQGNEAGQAQGYAVLSTAYIALKDTENAVEYLEQCLAVSESSGNVTIQGQANRSLGVIYNNCGKFKSAVENFKKYFEISTRDAISNSDADLYTINVARSLVGMAGANALMGACVHAIDQDIKGLLGWKCERLQLGKEVRSTVIAEVEPVDVSVVEQETVETMEVNNDGEAQAQEANNQALDQEGCEGKEDIAETL